MSETTEQFESEVIHYLNAKWDNLVVSPEYATPTEVGIDSPFLVAPYLFDSVFKEISNRLKGQRHQGFMSGGPGHSSYRNKPIDYIRLVYAGTDVGYGDSEAVEKMNFILNRAFEDQKIREIVRDYLTLENQLYSLKESSLADFDQEIRTIHDAVQDDNPILGKGSCDLCKDLK